MSTHAAPPDDTAAPKRVRPHHIAIGLGVPRFMAGFAAGPQDETLRELAVIFDGNRECRPLAEDVRQGATTGADLYDGLAGVQFERISNPSENPAIRQKMLTEAFPHGRHPLAAHTLSSAKRRW